MTKQSFVYKVQENGRLEDAARLEIAGFISQFPGKSLRFEISIYRKRRSDAQEGYYRAAVLPIVTRMLRDFGNAVNEETTHTWLKANVMMVGEMVKGPDGKEEFVPGSNADIKADEWSQKMEMVRAWAAMHGTQIPLPGENYDPIR